MRVRHGTCVGTSAHGERSRDPRRVKYETCPPARGAFERPRSAAAQRSIPRRGCSRCSPAERTRSASCTPSRAGSARTGSWRSTCTMACAPPRTRTSGSARSFAHRSACGSTSSASRSARRQPRGARPRGALRGGRGRARARGARPRRDRPHRLRPGRDDSLPARPSPGPPRAARHGAAARAASCARCSTYGARTRAPTARAAGLAWREDESNRDRSLARNRLRHEVIPALREIHPAAERNVLATAAELRDGAGGARAGRRRGRSPAAARAGIRPQSSSPAWRRARRRSGGCSCAGSRSARPGAPLPLGSERVGEIERLARAGRKRSGRPGRRRARGGRVRRRAVPAPSRGRGPAQAAALAVPGSCRFGAWEVRAERGARRGEARGSLDEPVLDAARLGPR